VAQLKELVEHIAKALVNHPEEVEVTETRGERTAVYEVRLLPEDLGRLIGRDGRTANAIRTVVSAAGKRENIRTRVEILD
jgi:uncharacterized protein